MTIRLNYFFLFIGAMLYVSIAFAQNKDQGVDPGGASKSNSVSTQANVAMVKDMDFSIPDFVKCYIVLPSNVLQYGLLRFNGSTVIFKDTLTEKTKRFNAQEINGFTATVDTSKIHTVSKAIIPGFLYNDVVIKKAYNATIPVDTFKVLADSFVVKSQGRFSFGDKIVHQNKFVKQLIYGEKVSLYKTTLTRNNPGTMMNGGMMTGGYVFMENIFYFKRKNEASYTEIPTGKRKFKKMMADYLKDNSQLVQDIDNDQYSFDQLEQITMIYNQKKAAN